MNEQSTIMQIIQPVLSDLDWDVYNSNEVRYEYQVSPHKGSGKPDIALMGKDDKCVCLVEAKSPSVNLDDYVTQLFRYDALNERGTVCVLTDGLEWRFYLPREKEGKPEERQFARLRLQEDPVEQIAEDLEKFLSRSRVVNGEAEQEAAKTLKQLREENDIARRLPEIWHQMRTEPDQELITWVKKRISEKHGFSPSEEQVKRIVETAPSQPTYSSNPASPEVSYRQDSKSQIDYTLFGVSKSRSGIGVWADVVKEVYYRHENDFWEKAEKLRLTPGSRRVLISGNPQSINRSKPTEVPELYIEYSLTQAECVNLAYNLLALFGHPPSDLQIHEE